jgi:hypothetical protein
MKTDTSKTGIYRPSSGLMMIVGNYGSGKTEVAVNLAIQEKKSGADVLLADLDIVNPYFRCREAQDLMRAHGVKVVMPPGSQQYADLPIIVPEIKGMLESDQRPNQFSLFDVGGDPVGATLLSSFNNILANRSYSLLQVINARRPFTDTVEGCIEMKNGIETSSRLNVSGFIINTHLVTETTPDVILEGYELGRKVSKKTGLPIEFVTAMGELADTPEVMAIPEPIFRLERIMLPPWLQTGKKDDSENEQMDVVPAGRTKPIFVP